MTSKHSIWLKNTVLSCSSPDSLFGIAFKAFVSFVSIVYIHIIKSVSFKRHFESWKQPKVTGKTNFHHYCLFPNYPELQHEGFSAHTSASSHPQLINNLRQLLNVIVCLCRRNPSRAWITINRDLFARLIAFVFLRTHTLVPKGSLDHQYSLRTSLKQHATNPKMTL